jgi:RNA polymerase sigma factor (sigma-70 family)
MTMTLPSAEADSELLERFIHRRDEAAFAELVQRHGPMVRATCRRSLAGAPEADDAFQAVFLVLARKAAGVRERWLLGPWLHTVAVRTSRKARALIERRRIRERPVREFPEPARAIPDDPHDWLPLLDAEIQRLPEKYRQALVLCELEGASRSDAAQHLALAEGTLSSRLARARALLRRRLLKRGVNVSAVALAAVLTSTQKALVPSALLASTTQAAATGASSASVAALTEGVIRTMLFAKVKIAAVVVLTLGLSAGVFTAGYVNYAARADDTSVNAEQKRLEGSWQMVAAELFGKVLNENDGPPDVKERRFVFKGDTVTVKSEVKYIIDPDKKPKEISLEVTDGPAREQGTWKGIYELNGDDLTICIALPGTDRPAKFETKEGEWVTLMKLKRVK